MITELQKKICQAIVNIFESGSAKGNYSAVTVANGDKGGLSYGIAQVSRASGNLYQLIEKYTQVNGEYGLELSTYLGRMKNGDETLDNDTILKLYLRQAGHDKIMQQCQEEYFDKKFWQPMFRKWTEKGYRYALSMAVMYDSAIQGGYYIVGNLVNKKYTAREETQWINHYVQERYKWLLTGAGILPKTIYRMQEFEKLLAIENWDLVLPIMVRGNVISEDILKA